MQPRLTSALILLVLAPIIICCKMSSPALDSKPSGANTNAGYQSGGLGLNSSEWESTNGRYVEKGPVSDVWVYESSGRKLYVTFWDDIVRAVEYNYPAPVSLD